MRYLLNMCHPWDQCCIYSLFVGAGCVLTKTVPNWPFVFVNGKHNLQPSHPLTTKFSAVYLTSMELS